MNRLRLLVFSLETVGIDCRYIGGMNERCFLQANIDEGSLHTRHHAYDLAIEDIAHMPPMIVTLDENLLQQTILDKRHSSLHRCHVDENFFAHNLFH